MGEVISIDTARAEKEERFKKKQDALSFLALLRVVNNYSSSPENPLHPQFGIGYMKHVEIEILIERVEEGDEELIQELAAAYEQAQLAPQGDTGETPIVSDDFNPAFCSDWLQAHHDQLTRPDTQTV